MLPDNDIIRRLIADNETEKAIGALAQHFDKYDFPDLQDDLALLSAKWEAWEGNQRNGTHSHDKLAEQKAQIDKALLSINRDLSRRLAAANPTATPPAAPSRSGGIREDKFKLQVFIAMVATKLTVIGWVLFHYTTHGLSSTQTLAIITLLLPTFSMYMAAMFNDFLENRYVSAKESPSPYIKNSLRWTTYLLFPFYLLLLLSIIGSQARGEFGQDMEKISSWLGIIETGLGVFIGKIVFTLFKKTGEGS